MNGLRLGLSVLRLDIQLCILRLFRYSKPPSVYVVLRKNLGVLRLILYILTSFVYLSYLSSNEFKVWVMFILHGENNLLISRSMKL